jgi:hypothetical protein
MQLTFDLKDFEGGSYADLTYQVIQRMIKVGPGILRPLYKSLVSVISNTAPYVKSLSKDSCESIFSLIKTFSNPELLKKREETSRILSNLFEAVNYILLYHDEGNEEFLVSLIKYREVLKINELKLAEGASPTSSPTHVAKTEVKPTQEMKKTEVPKSEDKNTQPEAEQISVEELKVDETEGTENAETEESKQTQDNEGNFYLSYVAKFKPNSFDTIHQL